jgi:hypothetical protein
MTTPISRIIDADICRDGGSYSFCFYSDDSQWYDKLVDQLTWEDGRNFLDGVEYDNQRFRELVAIVKAEGRS